MASPESRFPLEYVTGPIQLPTYAESDPISVSVFISVLNVGDAPSFAQAFGYGAVRYSDIHGGAAFAPSVQVLETADVEVAANVQFLYQWFQGGDLDIRQYWFKILAMSPDLVPSIEFMQGNVDNEPGEIFFRVSPGDFAVFHRRVRYVPQPVPVGPIVSE